MIKLIRADKNRISFSLDENYTGTVRVRAYSPATKEELLLGEADAVSHGGGFELDRFAFGRDGAFLRYETQLGGMKYVSHISSEYDEPYPDPGTKKGLQIVDVEDAKYLGVKHAALNIAITDVMRSACDPGAEPFEYDGHTYYINMPHIREHDARIKELTDAGVVITFILLCGRWHTVAPEKIKSVLYHPDYDPEGTLSAFNVQTDEGIRHYQAFCAFLARRYYRPDKKYGRVVGMIISNEVTAQWIWGNAGEKTCAEFAYEYVTAMRVAYLASKSVYQHFRTYISLDHFWGMSMDANHPRRFYSGLELLGEIRGRAQAEGDFYYNIAHHPYPEDLTKPDFWNDKTATDDYNTPRVTFKNLHILAEFLYKEENLFEGKRRRVILSEQGFNSCWTDESEILQATAYGRAYHEVMKIPEIDSFILHAHHDNAGEFGLNLGLWRRNKDKPGMERPKPVYYLFKAIDQKDESGEKYVWERF
ncbi:MAG: hypothetical protein J5879_03035 [Clostridia bacterium]|nr:hypothetical protein [Clostridia bacterium]